MILVNKKVGETPLELLNRLRVERPELAKEKPTKLALSESLIPFESSILSIALSDFEFLRSDLLKLEYYAVVFTDGNLVIDEREAELRRFGAGWKVSKITKAEAYMCHFEGD